MRGLRIALLVLLAGCRHEPPLSADVAARIGGRDVPYARFEQFLQRQVGEGAGALDSRVLSRLLDQFLEGELLTRLAIDEKRLPPGPGADPRKAAAALVGEAEAPISPADVEGYYRVHQAELQLPERVRVHTILVGSEAQADDARRRLEGGGDFAALAREVSLDPSAPAGGDQGEVSIEDLPAPFAQALQQLQPGETSEPIAASDGWHLFRLDERLPARARTLEEVTPEITDRLRRERSDALLQRRLAEAADRYNVVVFAQNLPFDYRGDHPRTDQKETP